MKRELLTATALTASAFIFGTSPASAQSSPIDWTGIYVSLAVGVDQLHDRVTTDGPGSPGSASFGGSPHVGTMGFGANHAVGALLLGFDVDINFLNSEHADYTSGGPYVETELDRLLTARAKIGIAHDKALFYATGGLAAGNASLSTSYDCGKGCYASGSGSQRLYGWTAGGGVEIKATNAVSVKLEGLYYRLNPISVEATGTTPSYTTEFTPQGWLIRLGLNVKLR